MSQSAVFPFFDRLLRQEVFPGKPKGVAEQLPIDLLALPEKAQLVDMDLGKGLNSQLKDAETVV